MIVGIFLFFFSVAMALQAYFMKSPDGFWTGPGVFPLITTIIIAICAIIWIIECLIGLKGKDIKKQIESLFAPLKDSASKVKIIRFAGIMALSLAYIFVLMPWLHFTLATLVFLLATCVLFTKAKLYVSVLTTVIVTFCIYAAFKYVLLLPMP